jgi:hypothetical protein
MIGAGVSLRTYTSSTSDSSPVLNNHGKLSFLTFLAGTGVTSNNNVAVLTGEPGSLSLRVRSGDLIPSIPSAIMSSFAVAPGTNDADEIALGTLTSSSTARALKVTGNTLSGISVSDFHHPISLAANGEFCLFQTSGGGNSSLNCGTTSGLSSVAVEGQHAAGMQTNIIFSDLGAPVTSGGSGPFMNASGQVAFSALVTGPGISTANDLGLWLTDPSDTLHLLLSEGQSFETEPGIIRTVLGFTLPTTSIASEYRGSGGQDGLRNPLNDSGEIAVSISFTDGTRGVFVLSIPEPATGLAMLVPVLALRRRTRIRRN